MFNFKMSQKLDALTNIFYYITLITKIICLYGGEMFKYIACKI